MQDDLSTDDPRSAPPAPLWLGYAGLLSQAAAVAMLVSGDLQWRFTALSLGYAYAALILSFLGGLWWGLAARAGRAPTWLWFAAIAPSLIALASAMPWATGDAWPKPSLAMLGFSLILALGVDYGIGIAGLSPPWWMALRVPLSLGLGVLTLAMTCL